MAPARPPSFLHPSCHKPLTVEPNAVTARQHLDGAPLMCRGLCWSGLKEEVVDMVSVFGEVGV